MYEHADQSWKNRPKIMSEDTRQQMANRIGEYASSVELSELLLVFHGGEPLLAGAPRIVETTKMVRDAVPELTRVDACVQTNGVLLTDEVIACLAAAEIGISVSIDGPQGANDLHRLDHGGASSFEKSFDAIKRLRQYPDVFNGLIAVVDPRITPAELFDFFAELSPPRLDFLLPDSNQLTPPPGRDSDADLYVRWMKTAFDLWFDHYSHLPVRTFDAILNGVAGMPSETDAFGFGDVSMLTIETDGTYHDLDVLKITTQGGTDIGLDVRTSSVAEAAKSEKIETHRRLLQREGIAEKCKSCEIVDICGGGAVPHRFDGQTFQNPTVYCGEMLGLVGHAKKRVRQALSKASDDSAAATQYVQVSTEDIKAFDDASKGRNFVKSLWLAWTQRTLPSFLAALDVAASMAPELSETCLAIKRSSVEQLSTLATQPSTVLWSSVMNQGATGVKSKSIDGHIVDPEPKYVQHLAAWLSDGLPSAPRLHRNDPWLRLPFGSSIIFEPTESIDTPREIAHYALDIIREWDAEIYAEICLLSPEIQFIQDPTAHPDKAVSFSDNTVPGALYVSVRRSGAWISAHDLADSIVHEHRHQKLYLLQANAPILTVDAPLVHSPWREDLRPPSGLFHAVFVFTELLRFWHFVGEQGPSEIRDYAWGEVRSVEDKLHLAFPVLQGTVLTKVGRELVMHLELQFKESLERMI
tara:strand:+ start:21282 stop:23372 length:2091 start_codon:yes stop_codon:yes gene_type:complete